MDPFTIRSPASPLVDREVVVLLPDQDPEFRRKVKWGTSTRVVWTVIAMVLHLAGAFSTPGWIAVLIILHLVWSITSIWRDTHG